MVLTAMIEQLTTITPVEGMLGIFAAALLVQCAIMRAHVNHAASKSRVVQFPGLLTALSRIPVRSDAKNR